MGVSWELDDLAATFKHAYGFNTETWLIPTAQPHLALMGKAFKMVQDAGQKDNLIIVYYAGHGGMNSSRQPLWHWSVSILTNQKTAKLTAPTAHLIPNQLRSNGMPFKPYLNRLSLIRSCYWTAAQQPVEPLLMAVGPV